MFCVIRICFCEYGDYLYQHAYITSTHDIHSVAEIDQSELMIVLFSGQQTDLKNRMGKMNPQNATELLKTLRVLHFSNSNQ